MNMSLHHSGMMEVARGDREGELSKWDEAHDVGQGCAHAWAQHTASLLEDGVQEKRPE